jgi:ribonuclease HIII
LSQQTIVLQVDAAGAATLAETLRTQLPADAQWRPVPHARFSVKSGSVVLTCYLSGKVVVQGVGAADFLARMIPNFAAADATSDALPIDVSTIGSDEVGKGDYFGPLVVAAVVVHPDQAKALVELGVADSKRLGDERMQRMAGALERLLPHRVEQLEPEAYNTAYATTPNVNELLADLHVRALTPLVREHPDAIVVVDRFANESLLARRFAAAVPPLPGIETRLRQIVRGERHPAVAAASILARVAFLDGLKRCSEACATDLHKGAGAVVDEDARRVHAIGGAALLRKIAKLHFKNSNRVSGYRP